MYGHECSMRLSEGESQWKESICSFIGYHLILTSYLVLERKYRGLPTVKRPSARSLDRGLAPRGSIARHGFSPGLLMSSEGPGQCTEVNCYSSTTNGLLSTSGIVCALSQSPSALQSSAVCVASFCHSQCVLTKGPSA